MRWEKELPLSLNYLYIQYFNKLKCFTKKSSRNNKWEGSKIKIQQGTWKTPYDFNIFNQSEGFKDAQLVMIFGCRKLISENEFVDSIQKRYPQAHLIGCTTAGEILGTQVFDDTLTSTAIYFEATPIESASVIVKTSEESYEAGIYLAEKLNKGDLKHVFVLSEGLKINASELVRSLKENLPNHVAITGGVAGDGTLFEKTMVISNGYATENIVTAIGLYGDHIRVGYGSVGGWDSFGPERLITKSKNNILYELDGKSALELYKLYLGDYAKGLPATGLLFPLSIRAKGSNEGIVRAMLRINEEDDGMFFAGDVPEGYYAKLMKANFASLVNGALEAAELSINSMETSPKLAILISCVGRKVVLRQRIEEEVEVVRDILGDDCIFTGFYSYGEISPYTEISQSNKNALPTLETGCELHNQTMTITTIMEV